MKKILILIYIIAFPIILNAQTEIQISNEITLKNGKKYYLHTIENGHTLYSISKAYNVSQKEINIANNNFSSHLVTGEVLIIPFIKAGKNNSPDYIMHKVKYKETLETVSKKYNISVNDIKKHNQDARFSIKKDQILKIPNIKKGNFDYQNAKFFFHTVESGQTLFSLSQKYGTTLEQIYLFNPGTKSGLKTGQVLRIPKGTYDITERLPVFHDNNPEMSFYSYDPLYFEEEGVTPCNSYIPNADKTFKIALMLPLFLEENYLLSVEYETKKDRLFYRNTQRFYEMYEGIILAFQQLKTKGLSADLYIYDTKNNPETVRNIMKKPEFSGMDLIIGPVYSKNVQAISYFVKKHKINTVTPLSQNNKLLENNPFIFEMMPSPEMTVKKTADFLSHLYDSSIVMIHEGSEKEQKLIDVYKQKLVRSFSWDESVKEIVLKNLNYNIGGEENLEDVLSVGQENSIVIPSKNEAFVTKIINKLYVYSKMYKINLYGFPNWESYQSVESRHLKALSFRYATSSFINYDNWRVKNFIHKYRDIYETEPSIYAFQGYDIAYYFMNALKTYGKHFQFCLSPYDKTPNRKGLSADFDFVRSGAYNGFENNGIFILEYNNELKLKIAEPIK